MGYYSETGDFVAAFNSTYAAIVSPALERKSSGGKSPMVVFDGADPVAMILPVKVDDKPQIIRTVRAWFIENANDGQPEADKAAALVEKLAALPNVTATIKGAKTAAPVVWLSGDTDAHKDEIERMGGKWSGKRSAWYFKV